MNDKWFKAQQKKAGVTAEDIARRAGRSRSNVSHILSGKQKMSLEWAQAFADVLKVPIAEVLEQAGAMPAQQTAQLRPGFAESDAVAFVQSGALSGNLAEKAIASALGADRPGVDLWQVKSRAMALGGYLEGDFVLVDTHQSERVRPGDIVLAQIYNHGSGTAVTVLRRWQPPVLVAASMEPDDMKVHVVDNANVVIRGKVIASWRA